MFEYAEDGGIRRAEDSECKRKIPSSENGRCDSDVYIALTLRLSGKDTVVAAFASQQVVNESAIR